MSSRVRPIPEGHAALTPYLITSSAARAIEFYAKAFGATEVPDHGARSVSLEDPFGHMWHVATDVEDVSEEEMKRRSAALHG